MLKTKYYLKNILYYIQCLRSSTTVQDSPSPSNKIQSGLAANMLQQLIAEAENKPIVYSDDLSSTTRQQQHLQGVKACQEDDVQYLNWLSKQYTYLQ